MWYTLYEQVNKQIYITIAKPRSLLFSHFMNEKNAKVTWYLDVTLFIYPWLACFVVASETQHPQNSVHGICFCDNCTFLHVHFCICTFSGAVLPQ